MRILFVTEYLPYRTDFGAQQRSHLMWQALQEVGEVDVLLLQPGSTTRLETPIDSRLAAQATFDAPASGLATYAPDGKLGKLVAGKLDLDEYDVVCGRYLRPISKLDLPRDVPTIVDLDDINYSYAAGNGFAAQVSATCKTFVRRVLQRSALSRFSRYWFVSERDRYRFSELPGGVLPNVPISDGHGSDFRSSGSTLLFVGALWYGPNRDGMEHFLEVCWPEIRRAVPEAQLNLVGGGPKDLRDRWARTDGVRAPGFLRDLRGAYAQAAFAIAPIYNGGGTSIKVLESLAMGRACVTTTHCLESFLPHFDGRSDIVAAEDDEVMTQSCIRLLREPLLREPLAQKGRQIVVERFSYEIFRNAVHEQVRLAVARQTA